MAQENPAKGAAVDAAKGAAVPSNSGGGLSDFEQGAVLSSVQPPADEWRRGLCDPQQHFPDERGWGPAQSGHGQAAEPVHLHAGKRDFCGVCAGPGDQAAVGDLAAPNNRGEAEATDEEQRGQDHGRLHRIDCSVIFVLIGPITIILNDLNLIM